MRTMHRLVSAHSRIAVAALLITFGATTATLAGQTPARPAPPRPAASPVSDRFFVNFGGGFQIMSTTFDESHSEPLASETSYWNASYALEDHVAFMGGFGVRVWRNLVATVSYSHQQQHTPARVTGQIPHPFFFDRPRSLEGESSSLDHREQALHISATWLAPLGNRFELAVSGGPTLFSITRGFVDDLEYSEEYPYDTVTFTDVSARDVSERTLGAHAGAELTWLLTPHIGISGIVRYSHGSITLDTPSANTVSLDAGGLQAGVALRLGFGGNGSAPPRPPSRVDQPVVPPRPTPLAQFETGVIVSAANVYLKPDRSRQPLRTLDAGTIVKILEVEGEWLRIEFTDAQFGPRMGYVAKAFVKMGKVPQMF
jgi:hypothetical protein